MSEENTTYLVKVWNPIPQADGSVKNTYTVVGTVKRRVDQQTGELRDEFTLFLNKGIALTGQCSIQPYIKKEDMVDKSDDGEVTLSDIGLPEAEAAE